MRKPVLAPSLEHFLFQLSKNDEVLVTVLKGHLVIEALLVEVVQLRLFNDQPWKWSFPKKVDWCIESGYLSDEEGDAIKGLNDIRNDFAHILGHRLTFDTVFSLAEKLNNAGFIFSDETIYSDQSLSEEWYGIDGAIIEILNTIFFHLAGLLAENGSNDYSDG